MELVYNNAEIGLIKRNYTLHKACNREYWVAYTHCFVQMSVLVDIFILFCENVFYD